MSTRTARRAADPTPSPRRTRPGLVIVGLILVLAGLLAGGWAVYGLYFAPLVDERVAEQEITDLRGHWEDQPVAGAPIPGEAMALVRIPRFGETFEQPLLAGTTQATLKKGLGWFDTTAEPGQVGNFALAGHRGTKGPLAPIMNLHVGDRVVVETRASIYTYELTNNPSDLTVKNTELWVLDPVPGKAGESPTEPTLTVVTCEDLFHSPDRAIAFGRLIETRAKKQP